MVISKHSTWGFASIKLGSNVLLLINKSCIFISSFVDEYDPTIGKSYLIFWEW